MTFQTLSAPVAFRFFALHAGLQWALDWLRARPVIETSVPISAHLLRDAGLSRRSDYQHDAKPAQMYRDRHMPLA